MAGTKLKKEIREYIVKTINKYRLQSKRVLTLTGLNPSTYDKLMNHEGYGVSIEAMLKSAVGLGIGMTLRTQSDDVDIATYTISRETAVVRTIDRLKMDLAGGLEDVFRTTKWHRLGVDTAKIAYLIDNPDTARIETLINRVSLINIALKIEFDSDNVKNVLGTGSDDTKDDLIAALRRAYLIASLGNPEATRRNTRQWASLDRDDEIRAIMETLSEVLL